MDDRFGTYLKELRENRTPVITQEKLGELLPTKKKGKMTISQIENGKNAPPQGVFLDDIVAALCLTEKEETNLRDLAALARGTVPSDIAAYFYENERVRELVRICSRKKLSQKKVKVLIEKAEEM